VVIWFMRTTDTADLCATSLSFCPRVLSRRLRLLRSTALDPCRKWNATESTTTSRTGKKWKYRSCRGEMESFRGYLEKLAEQGSIGPSATHATGRGWGNPTSGVLLEEGGEVLHRSELLRMVVHAHHVDALEQASPIHAAAVAVAAVAVACSGGDESLDRSNLVRARVVLGNGREVFHHLGKRGTWPRGSERAPEQNRVVANVQRRQTVLAWPL
jgi:hypothetical protein